MLIFGNSREDLNVDEQEISSNAKFNALNYY